MGRRARTPEHGDFSRYRYGPDENDTDGKPCRCRLCRDTNNRVSKIQRLNRARGQGSSMVDAGPVRDHVLALQDAGLFYKRVADMAGVSADTVVLLLRGRRATGSRPTSRMQKRTAEALLAVRADQIPQWGKVSAVGPRRRLQALAVVGWSTPNLAPRVGINERNLWRITAGVARRVDAKTARSVRVVYDQLWDVDPAKEGIGRRSSDQARRSAAAKGWAPPAAWDDDEIDDAAAVPDLGESVHRYVALAEDAEELLAQGVKLEHVEIRLGVTRKYLDNSRRKAAERGLVTPRRKGENMDGGPDDDRV